MLATLALVVALDAPAFAALPGIVRSSAPALSDSWTPTDFTTATCGYIAPALPLTFSLPPGFTTRNPRHGAVHGCFWGTQEDLDRSLLPKTENFERLTRGLFQARRSTNLGWDRRTGRFGGEAQMPQALAESGVRDARVERRKFGNLPGLVVTGKTATTDLYMLYLAHGSDEHVVLISYRPPTVAAGTGTEAATIWQRFLDSIH